MIISSCHIVTLMQKKPKDVIKCLKTFFFFFFSFFIIDNLKFILISLMFFHERHCLDTAGVRCASRVFLSVWFESFLSFWIRKPLFVGLANIIFLNSCCFLLQRLANIIIHHELTLTGQPLIGPVFKVWKGTLKGFSVHSFNGVIISSSPSTFRFTFFSYFTRPSQYTSGLEGCLTFAVVDDKKITPVLFSLH